MEYIEIEDLTSLIKGNIVDNLSEDDYSLINQLELMAFGELDAGIGFKFDTKAALEGGNSFLKMMLVDICLYHFTSRMSHVDMQEIREVRYVKVQEWIKDVAMGKIVPNLPLNDLEAGETRSRNLYITEPKLTQSW